jgi:hypothetical protein
LFFVDLVLQLLSQACLEDFDFLQLHLGSRHHFTPRLVLILALLCLFLSFLDFECSDLLPNHSYSHLRQKDHYFPRCSHFRDSVPALSFLHQLDPQLLPRLNHLETLLLAILQRLSKVYRLYQSCNHLGSFSVLHDLSSSRILPLPHQHSSSKYLHPLFFLQSSLFPTPFLARPSASAFEFFA